METIGTDYEDKREEAGETLLDRAIVCCRYANMPWTLKPDDTAYLNLMAFHLQQAVELAMRHLLSEGGAPCPETHDIEQLLRIGRANGIDMNADGYIAEHAEMFSCWRTKARYQVGYKVELHKVQAAMTEVRRYLGTIKETEENKQEE